MGCRPLRGSAGRCVRRGDIRLTMHRTPARLRAHGSAIPDGVSKTAHPMDGAASSADEPAPALRGRCSGVHSDEVETGSSKEGASRQGESRRLTRSGRLRPLASGRRAVRRTGDPIAMGSPSRDGASVRIRPRPCGGRRSCGLRRRAGPASRRPSRPRRRPWARACGAAGRGRDPWRAPSGPPSSSPRRSGNRSAGRSGDGSPRCRGVRGQVTLERLVRLAVDEGDQRVRGDRLLDLRGRRLLDFFFLRSLRRRQAGERRMHLRDQGRKLGRRERVVRDIGRDEIGGEFDTIELRHLTGFRHAAIPDLPHVLRSIRIAA